MAINSHREHFKRFGVALSAFILLITLVACSGGGGGSGGQNSMNINPPPSPDPARPDVDGPDLSVSVRVNRARDLDGVTLNPGQRFVVRITIVNIGDTPSSPTTLRYYRSNDPIISRSDTQIDTAFVRALGDGLGGFGESIDLSAPANPGTYYYGACVDEVPEEEDPSDDCSEGARVIVAAP